MAAVARDVPSTINNYQILKSIMTLKVSPLLGFSNTKRRAIAATNFKYII